MIMAPDVVATAKPGMVMTNCSVYIYINIVYMALLNYPRSLLPECHKAAVS